MPAPRGEPRPPVSWGGRPFLLRRRAVRALGTDRPGRIAYLVPVSLIVAYGTCIARSVGNTARGHCHGADVGDAASLGRNVRYAMLICVSPLATDRMRNSVGKIEPIFLPLHVGVAFALAPGFSLGACIHPAARLECWSQRDRSRRIG